MHNQPLRHMGPFGLLIRVIRIRQLLLTLSWLAVVASSARAQGDTTVTIRALSSTLEFVPASISVKTGRRLRLRFTNDGTLPHNFVLAKRDDDIDEIAVAAYQAAESGFVPPSVRDKLIAWTKLASPGETVEVEFVVPAPGSYTYICLFPGHAASMLGTLRALK